MEFLDFYVCNPDDVHMVYWRRDAVAWCGSGGSALVWQGKQRVYLDRVYCTSYISIPGLIDRLCEDVARHYGKPCVPIYNCGDNHTRYEGKVTFRLNYHGGALPWCDTLCHLTDFDRRANRLTLTTDGDDDEDILVQNSDGTWPTGETGSKRVQCPHCGERCDEDDLYTVMTNTDEEQWCSSCVESDALHDEYFEGYVADDVEHVSVLTNGNHWNTQQQYWCEVNNNWEVQSLRIPDYLIPYQYKRLTYQNIIDDDGYSNTLYAASHMCCRDVNGHWHLKDSFSGLNNADRTGCKAGDVDQLRVTYVRGLFVGTDSTSSPSQDKILPLSEAYWNESAMRYEHIHYASRMQERNALQSESV